MKLRRMRGGMREMHTEFQSEYQKGINGLGDLGVDGRIIVDWILKRGGLIHLMRFSGRLMRTW
jgi:hypothetical protein